MYSIIEQGGVQFKVAKGDVIRVPLVNAEEGAELTIDKVLMTADGEDINVGTPVVDGASVTAKVLNHDKDDKVLVIKKKRRKDYKRKNGHRQNYTNLEILSLNA